MKGGTCTDVSSCIDLKVFDRREDGESNRTHIFEGICDSQPPREPPECSVSWYSHPCVPFHTLVSVTNRVQQKYVTFYIEI